jgi:hypothetical protein
VKYCSCTRDGTILEVFENIAEAEYNPNKNIVTFKANGIGMMFSGMVEFLILPDSIVINAGDPVTDELRSRDIRQEVPKGGT